MYNVAFRYTEKAGAYKGACTWTTYESKEDFDKSYTTELREREEVIAEGISDEECIKLTAEGTPLSTKLRIALEESANRKTGETNEFRLKMEMTKLRILGAI